MASSLLWQEVLSYDNLMNKASLIDELKSEYPSALVDFFILIYDVELEYEQLIEALEAHCGWIE